MQINVIPKTKRLALINEKVCVCEKCPALVANRTQTVFGVGNPNAKIVFLGEGPGAEEDKKGEPFVGRAGKLLDNILQACGWTRNDVYILNCVKCRPPNNRNPELKELNNCSPFLDLQLKVIQPSYIVCLGSVASRHLLGANCGVGRLRGEWHEIDEPIQAKVICSWHPAYLLRNPKAKADVWEDLQPLLNALEGAQ